MEREKKSLDELCEELASFRPNSIRFSIAFSSSYNFFLNCEDAEDVVGQATFNAYRALKLGQFRNEASLNTWFRRILINQVFMFMRTSRNRGLVDIDQFDDLDSTPFSLVESSPEERLLSEEDARRMRRALSSVRNRGGREVLFLQIYEDLSVKEIGKMVGVSRECVKSRLLRARNEVAKNIEKDSKMTIHKFLAKGAGA